MWMRLQTHLGGGEFLFEEPAGVRLGEDAGLEIEFGRQAQVGVRGPSVAINTSVGASLVGIHGSLEPDVGRLVL